MLGGQAFWASGQRWDWNLGQRSNPDPPELVAEMFGQAPATTYLYWDGSECFGRPWTGCKNRREEEWPGAMRAEG